VNEASVQVIEEANMKKSQKKLRCGDLCVSEWKAELSNIEMEEREFILTGLLEGFRITNVGNTEDLPVTETENYASCAQHHEAVTKQIEEEIENGRYVKAKDKPRMVSPLGALPKADGKVRLIHDASAPMGNSINDNYEMREKVKYDSVNDFCKQIARNWFMAKVDLQSAFRSVGIHPVDYEATGLKWRFPGNRKATFLQDRRLPFGCRASVEVFHSLSKAVKKMVSARGVQAVSCLLDDFAVAGPSFESCDRALGILIDILRRLGFSINWKKVECPSQCMQFLGVEIDSVKGTMTLPEEKRKQFCEEVHAMSQKTRISKRNLQKLCGKLNWVCQVVRVGSAFARPLYSALSALKQSQHTVRPDQCFRDAMNWWKAALRSIRPVKIWQEKREKIVMETDASLTGAGVVLRSENCVDWLYINWQLEGRGCFTGLHINYLEAVTPLLALLRLGSSVKNARISIYCDSEAACGMLNRGSSANMQVNRLFQTASLWCIATGCTFKAFHVPGSFQIYCDALSRLTDSSQLVNFCCRMFDSPSQCSRLLGHGLSAASNHFLALQVLALKSRLALTPATDTSSATHTQRGLGRRTAATCEPGTHSAARITFE
jgi:hypothetical protein